MIEIKNQEITDNSDVDDVSKFPRRDNFFHDESLELPGRTIFIQYFWNMFLKWIKKFNKTFRNL